MKALLQRVSEASVEVEGRRVGSIGKGLLILLCAERGDTDKDLSYILRKVLNLRIFEDQTGKMNLSVNNIGGEILVVPQFTLAARVKKGNRPSFDDAEAPQRAEDLFNRFVEALTSEVTKVETGRFGRHMKVSLLNDGPVTIMVDSRL